VSGDVVLQDSADGAIGRLMRAAAKLFEDQRFAPAALVGGLAVTLRIATSHRATVDVDTVVDGDAPRRLALDYLSDGDVRGSGRIEIDGVHVDVMETEALPAREDALPDDEHMRLFVLAHRWALESATQVGVRMVSESSASEPVSLRVAIVPALIGCKLHAIADRRGDSAAKQESDALDLLRLLEATVREPALTLSFESAPFDLALLVGSGIGQWFGDGALRTARLLRRAGVPGNATMEPDDIRAIGEAFADVMRGR
jgi:hypothetical protein